MMEERMPASSGSDKPIKPRECMQSPQLGKDEFKQLYSNQFFDPAFRAVQAELDTNLSVA